MSRGGTEPTAADQLVANNIAYDEHLKVNPRHHNSLDTLQHAMDHNHVPHVEKHHPHTVDSDAHEHGPLLNMASPCFARRWLQEQRGEAGDARGDDEVRLVTPRLTQQATTKRDGQNRHEDRKGQSEVAALGGHHRDHVELLHNQQNHTEHVQDRQHHSGEDVRQDARVARSIPRRLVVYAQPDVWARAKPGGHQAEATRHIRHEQQRESHPLMPVAHSEQDS
mmetsp:Transcript_7980/g.21996  ORF Transcript_7980/g.21996 Transcript_7980/m.21996 type:complete len:223 (+) Transcript_7980:215-883(+)